MAVNNVGLFAVVLAISFINHVSCRPYPAEGPQASYDKSDLGHNDDSGAHTDIYLDNGVARPRGVDCNRGLIDNTVKEAYNILHGLGVQIDRLVDNVAPDQGVVKNVGDGVYQLFQHAISGLKKGLEDTACGLGNIADEIASGIDEGDITGGVKSIGEEFFGGLGNIGRDITSAFSQAAQDLLSDVSDIDIGG